MRAGVKLEIENAVVDFPCPECEHRFQVSLYQLFYGTVYTCPTCGASSIGGELSEINRGLKKVERELRNLQETRNKGDFRLKWINVLTGQWGEENKIVGSKRVTISAPDSGSWIAAMIRL